MRSPIPPRIDSEIVKHRQNVAGEKRNTHGGALRRAIDLLRRGPRALGLGGRRLRLLQGLLVVIAGLRGLERLRASPG